VLPSSSHHGRPPVVRIGCCPIPLQRLQAFLGALQIQAPCAETEVLHLDTAEQVARLRSGDLDLGVIEYAEPAPPIRVRPLYAGERVAVVLPPGHPLAARTAIRPGDLEGNTLLSPPRTANPAFHDVLDRTLVAAGHRVRRRRETRGSHPHDVLFAVAQGHGLALGPSSILRNAGELGTMLSSRQLDPPVHLPDTQLAWRADPPSALADAAQRVADELYAFSSRQ
jgi:DNA-binding transcriptional LysR family regulator